MRIDRYNRKLCKNSVLTIAFCDIKWYHNCVLISNGQFGFLFQGSDYVKKISVILSVLFILFGIFPLSAIAESIDTQRDSSLTLQYRYDEEVFPDLMVHTYRVADISEKGELSLTGQFREYQINIEGIQSQNEWRRIATTLAAYIAADGISATKSMETDKDGFVCFENLQPGMYLTLSVRTEKENTVTVFETFLTVIPYPQGGKYQYDVTAYPKCEQFTNEPAELTYKVVKQWKDGSYTNLRPSTVLVDILKDGVLQSSQVLSSENNWCYIWNAPDDGAKWQAVERDIEEHYTVSVEEYDTTIVITNVYEHNEKPPQTGDSTMPHVYLLIIGSVGLILVLTAVWRKRAGI